jgi:gentisate 1,2-dioxygenase
MSDDEQSIGERLEELYGDMADVHMQPLWTQTADLMPRTPKPAAVPWLWRWSTMRAIAERAGELVTVERGGERRAIALANPGLSGKPYASNTLWGAVQYLGPHESAPNHRHSPSAIRFVLEGEGVWTTVNGDACDMHPGDLVLTPSWSWHDHNNNSDQPMLWFDGLDLPAVIALDAVFFDPEPPADIQQVEGEHNRSTRVYGGRGLLPLDDVATTPGQSPLWIYPWADTDAALSNLLTERGGPMVSMRFVDPTTGRSAMQTIGCEMHRIVPGEPTTPVRRTGSAIYVVYRGTGSSVIAGKRFDWGPGDMFVVPSWAALEHQATEASDLFAVTDRPVLEPLGLYQEERLAGQQEVTGSFEG